MNMKVVPKTTPRFLNQDTMEPPRSGGCLQQSAITTNVDSMVETVDQDRVNNLVGCSSSHGESRDDAFVSRRRRMELNCQRL